LDSFTPTSLPDHDDIIDSLAMHLGFTRPGDAVIKGGKENILDGEYLKREIRLRREVPGAWNRGTKWAV
jgi:hypothetical protein